MKNRLIKITLYNVFWYLALIPNFILRNFLLTFYKSNKKKMKKLLIMLMIFPLIGIAESKNYLLETSNANQIITYSEENTKQLFFNRNIYAEKLLQKLKKNELKVQKHRFLIKWRKIHCELKLSVLLVFQLLL